MANILRAGRLVQRAGGTAPLRFVRDRSRNRRFGEWRGRDGGISPERSSLSLRSRCVRDELGQGKRDGERAPEKVLPVRSRTESEERRPREGSMEQARQQLARLREMTWKRLSQRTPYQEQ